MSRLALLGLRSRLAGPFDFSVGPGECIVIAGPSGAGKSLLLRMIADLDPNDGEVLLDGRSRASFSGPEWRRRVTYCAAEPGWWAERVALHFPPPVRAAAQGLMAELGLDPMLCDAPIARLSTGERQRMALIRALVGNPDVLLLDEPTGALDQASTTRVEQVVGARLRGGTAVLMVTHNPAQAERLGHRCLHMQGGRIA